MPFLFNSPWMLLFGIAAAIPVLIHLLSTKKHSIVPFSALHFLVERNRSMLRMARIRKNLLLFLRMLILLLLALAAASPFSRGGGELATIAGEPCSLIVLMDRSMLMKASSGGISLNNKAINLVQDMINRLPEGSETELIFYSDASDFRSSGFQTPENALDFLKKYQPGWRSPQPENALKMAKKMLSNANFPIIKKAIIGAGLSRLTSDSEAKNDFLNNCQIIDLLPTDMINAGITDITFTPSAASLNMPVTVKIAVHNFSSVPLRELPVHLEVNGVKVNEWIVDVPPQESLVTTFRLTLNKSGWSTVKASLRADSFPVDDSRYAALYIPPGINVLIVEGNRPAFSPAGETFYAALALNPLSTTIEEISGSMKTTSINKTQLSKTSLNAWDVILLADPSVVDESTAEKIIDYVNRGGALILSSGSDTNPEIFNDIWLKLLPGEAVLSEIISSGSDEPFNAIVKEQKHPSFETTGLENGYGLSEIAVKNARFMELSPEWNVSLMLDEISPLMAWTDSGKGRITIFGMGLSTEWSNLPVSPFFVPIIHGMVYHSARLKLYENSLSPSNYIDQGSQHNIYGPLPDNWGDGVNYSDKAAVRNFAGDLNPGFYLNSMDDKTSLVCVNAEIKLLEQNWKNRTFSDYQTIEEQDMSSAFIPPKDLQPVVLGIMIALMALETLWSARR